MNDPSDHLDLRIPDAAPAPLREYAHLTEDDMVAIMSKRIHELEAEHFRARLILGEIEQSDPAAAAQQRSRIAELTRRLDVYRRNAMLPESTDGPPSGDGEQLPGATP